MDFTPEIEYQSPEVIRQFQEEKLREQIAYLQVYSPYYKRLFAEHNIDSSKIEHLEDLRRIPFTTKLDMEKYNEDFLCVPKWRVIDYIFLPGSDGKSVRFARTDSDLERLAYNEALAFSCAGLRPGSVIMLIPSKDLPSISQTAYFIGIRKLKASIIHMDGDDLREKWEAISDMKPYILMSTPSCILQLLDYADSHGIDYRQSSVKRIIAIGDALRDHHFELNSVGKSIKERWDVDLMATYSSSTMSIIFSECECGCGGHHHPELLIVEIVDKNGNPVPTGETGEVVVTTLGVEGMPLLRLRTGNMACIHPEPCHCGRNSFRVSPVLSQETTFTTPNPSSF